jgi:hypothetical protein
MYRPNTPIFSIIARIFFSTPTSRGDITSCSLRVPSFQPKKTALLRLFIEHSIRPWFTSLESPVLQQ